MAARISIHRLSEHSWKDRYHCYTRPTACLRFTTQIGRVRRCQSIFEGSSAVLYSYRSWSHSRYVIYGPTADKIHLLAANKKSLTKCHALLASVGISHIWINRAKGRRARGKGRKGRAGKGRSVTASRGQSRVEFRLGPGRAGLGNFSHLHWKKIRALAHKIHRKESCSTLLGYVSS